MPLSGTGMLITLMDVPTHEEADFNDWYDKEHLAERVEIHGFLEARRYEAVRAQPKYLNLYTTRTFDVLDSPAYHKALANQTERSKHHIPQFLNGTRAIARIAASVGQGRGGYVGFLHLRPGEDPAAQAALRAALTRQVRAVVDAGLISAHLVEGDAALSRPLMTDESTPPVTDWFVIVDGTQLDATERGLAQVVQAVDAPLIVAQGTYRLLWDLSKNEL